MTWWDIGGAAYLGLMAILWIMEARRRRRECRLFREQMAAGRRGTECGRG